MPEDQHQPLTLALTSQDLVNIEVALDARQLRFRGGQGLVLLAQAGQSVIAAKPAVGRHGGDSWLAKPGEDDRVWITTESVSAIGLRAICGVAPRAKLRHF